MEQQDAQQPVFNIEKIYVKDLSVEVPNAPQIFLEQKDPSINVDLSTSATPLENGFFEVVLKATVTAKLEDERTVFLVEAAQAGIFLIQNIGQEDIQPVLMVGCPNILLPYLRETVSSATNRAGFQPVMLTPVNFEALYMARQQQLSQQAGNA
ncbi:protein-export chaperone SecB [Viridibacterium curvum]|uniref:Protein-export protein SecB n=1 Tax=Viridibacterium curvum TaxID=1101404 RepID=A0ABP9QCU8_9RHOO